ncbi:MMPL family transporter [Paraconexibacter antarcticus]|uniref:MMPL family transporter n=1 Tax=Paraconexibacter antarcticus TaxID=2949664 RepID=A0ABY5DSB4_9ACTN|nr:MMPL family transporter [Paraconexibacter antarcticus]UTI63459.1 MMPL family transporter [Paraconexibacter antarcticus]
MQAIMLRLDGVLRRRRHVVLALWIVALVAAVPLAAQQSKHLTGGGFTVPGSQSAAVSARLDHEFPAAVRRSTLAGVVVPGPGATPAEVRAAVAELGRGARAVSPRARLVPAARHAALRAVAAHPERPLVVPLRIDADDNATADIAADLRKELALSTRAQTPVGLHLVGQAALYAGLQDLSKDDLSTAERTGFPIVLLILLAVFGSLAAATLPLALGAGSVLVTGALIAVISRTMEMSVFVTNMASMIGIGVAVDYSLFVLARYREEIHAGREPDEARAVALATSGVAVLFSGATVIVSLAGLYMVHTTAIRSMALGAILVVAVSMLASATLLPVLIRLLGHRAYARGRVFQTLQLAVRSRAPRRRGSTHPDAPPAVPFWERWTAAVMRRPRTALLGAALVLVTLAVPALSLQTGNGALRQFPKGYETRVGFEAAASLAGPGAFAPIKVTAPAREAAAAVMTLQADGGVASVTPAVPSLDGRSVLLTAFPQQDGESTATKDLVARLRDALPPGAQVGGNTGLLLDFQHTVAGSMWKIVLFVLLLSYVVLMVLLRSVLLPLKAIVLNLLSVGTAYGVLVIVFQWGWVDAVLGTDLKTGTIDTITPPLVLAVVFGLSMDYEIFLLSRIRERYTATGDTRLAVAQGLASSARTITSAALIMVAVFAVFVGTGVPSIKQLGVGNAVAIGVDATLVRLILVPAIMELLGPWSWWMPKILGRLVPHTSLEELEPGALVPHPT